MAGFPAAPIQICPLPFYAAGGWSLQIAPPEIPCSLASCGAVPIGDIAGDQRVRGERVGGHVFPFPSLPCIMLLAVTLSLYKLSPCQWLFLYLQCLPALASGSRGILPFVVPGCFRDLGPSAPAHISINNLFIKVPFKSQPGSLFFPLELICGRTQNREQ